MDWLGEELPEIYHIAFSPDGRLMAAACQDGALRVWSWPERKPLFRAKGIGCEINMVFFSPDGSAIWSIADDGAVRVHKVAHRGDQCREIKLSNLSLPSGCVHDNCLFVGDTDAGITKVDPATGSVLWSARVGSGRVESVAAKADGTILAVGLVDGLVALVDASSATSKGQFRLVPDIRWIDWFGNDIVVGGPANRVSYHNGADFRQIWSWSNGGNEARSVSILKRHDANPLVVAGADPGKVVLLDPASGNIERAYHGAPEIVRHACPSPDGNQLVAVGRNGPPTVFDATRSQEIRNWNHPTGKWVDARWADNSTLLALDTNGAIWALTTSAMNLRTSLPKPSAEAMAIGFVIGGPILWKCGSDVILSTKDTNSRANFIVGLDLGGFYIDNEFCAVAIKEKIIFATALDGFSRFRHIKFAEERLEAVNIVRDGSTLAVTCEHTVIVYSLPEMVELARFPRSEFFGALCAHIPSPGTLCIGRRSGELRMLDLKTMSFRSSIQVSPHPVSAITSHEPSGLLFTASIEGRVFTHGLRSGTVGPEWKIPSSQIISKLAISQSGERLMSLSESGRQSMITLWC
jgi:WD40 repeat protein